ncbi:MAG: hypothetical protein OEY33_01700, partial [Bdellovibrionales bacterium]|nr:hypothetical protein [Bdellovibrionales bacterium]
LDDETPLAGGDIDGGNTEILIDGVPIISSITPPDNRWWTIGESLKFDVKFSEPVFLTGSIFLPLNIGGELRNASYFSGNGSDTLTFNYNINIGDEDIDGIALNNNFLLLGANSSLVDSKGKNAVLTITELIDLSGVLVTTSSPSIVNINGPNSGFYKAGDKVEFEVVFNRGVIVSGGAPFINLEVGNLIKPLNYISGSGTQVLKFEYIFGPLDYDTDGVVLKSPIILPNGVSLKSLDGTFDADKIFQNVSFAQVKVDNLPPSNISILINNGENATNNLNVNLNLSAVDDNTIQMYITNTPSCASDGVWENFTPIKPWTLSTSNFNNRVYVKFRDSNLNETACISDTIFHDDVPPLIIISESDLSYANFSDTVNFYITYGGAETITLSANDVLVNKTGNADVSNIVVSNSGITRTVTLSGFTGDGSLSISLNPSTASDSAGNQTLFAGPSSTFIVDNTPPTTPGTPDFTDPDNIDTDGDDIELIWTNSSDQNSISYRVLTFEDSSCTNLYKDHGTNTVLNGGTSKFVFNNLPFKTLWAKVVAIDIAGNETQSSCSGDNIIVHNSPPVDNMANPQFGSDSLTGNDIELSWTAFSDPTGVSYDVYLYKDPNGCGINQTVYDLNTTLTNVNGSIDGLVEGFYHARILATNAIGLSTFSECTQSPIMVDNEAPRVNPNGIFIDIVNNLSSTGQNIELSWNPFLDVTLTNHSILVFSDSSCTNLYQTFVTNQNINESSGLVEINDTNNYYFKIKAVDGQGRETISDCSFEKLLVDFDPPVFNGGATSTLGIPLWSDNYINNETSLNGQIESGSFTDFSSLSYKVRVFSDNNCSSENLVKTLNSQSTSFNFNEFNLSEGTYYTLVVAKDEVGNEQEGICSSGGTRDTADQTFTIDDTGPSILQISHTTSGWGPDDGGQLSVGDSFQFDFIFNEEVIVNQPNEVNDRLKADFQGNNPDIGVSSNWSIVYDDTVTPPNNNTIRFQTNLPAEAKSNSFVNLLDIVNEVETVKDKADNPMENISLTASSLLGIRGIGDPYSVVAPEVVPLGPPVLTNDPILCDGATECNAHQIDNYKYYVKGFVYSEQSPSSSYDQYLGNVGYDDVLNDDLEITLIETSGSGVFTISELDSCTGNTQNGINILAPEVLVLNPLNRTLYTTSDPASGEAPDDFCKFKINFNENNSAILGFNYRADVLVRVPTLNYAFTIKLFVTYE